MKHYLLFSFSLLFLLASCNTYLNTEYIIGNWKTSQWIRLDTYESVKAKMAFNFDENGTYLVDYGAQKENGTYWFAGEFLHTLEEGQSEKSVRIAKLTMDSLVIDMNRSGVMERVILLKRD